MVAGFRSVACFVVWFFPWNAGSAADEGRWPELSFRGNVTFDSKQLEDELTSCVDFLIATYPGSLPEEILPVIERLLTRGYQHAGFPSPKVKATQAVAGGVIKISISEGIRFRRGAVKVIGADEIDSGLLVERLTKPYCKDAVRPVMENVNGKVTKVLRDADGQEPDLESPIWKAGEWARFDEKDDLRQAVKAACTEFGYARPTFEISFKENETTADLLIRVEDLGPPSKIEWIVFEGLRENSREAMIEYLGIDVGVVADRDLIDQINMRLWDSGRFAEYETLIEPSEDQDGSILRLTVEEFPGVPAVDQPLNREAETLLKARRWIYAQDGGVKDLVAKVPMEGAELLIVKSQAGLLLKLTEVAAPARGEQDQSEPFAVLMIHGNERLLCDSRLGRKCYIPSNSNVGFDGRLSVSVQIGASKADDKLTSLTFSFKTSSRRAPGQASMEASLRLPPARIIGLAYKQKASHTWEDEHHLKSTIHECVARIDARTGETRLAINDSFVGLELGRYEHEREILLRQTNSMKQAYDPALPLSSLFAYVCDPVLIEPIFAPLAAQNEHIPSLNRHVIAGVQKLLEAGLLRPADDWIIDSQAEEGDDEDFSIPVSEPSIASKDAWVRHFGGALCVTSSNKFFSSGTWPALVLSESGYVMLGRNDRTSQVLKTLYMDPINGPICHCVVAAIMGRIQPAMQSRFAARAASQFNEAAFVRDYRALMGGSVGKWLHEMISAWQSLEPDEAEAILANIEHPTIAKILRKIYEASDLSPELGAGRLWYQATQDELRAWLASML